MTRFSILICSLVSRQSKLDHLLRSLYTQILALPPDQSPMVEVIFEVDNKQITTGAKRNKLLDRASGKYIAFIDDDDRVYPNYISAILEALKDDPDCVATRGHYSENGGHKTEWRLSKSFRDYDGAEFGNKILFRRANHLTPVKREHALKARFPDISNAEDKAYSAALNQYLITEHEITEPIYHYDYETFNKQY